MRLSTTINFFNYPNDGTMTPYFDDMRKYQAVGFRALDAILCAADREDSPLWADDWRGWAEQIAQEAARLGISFAQTHLPFYNFTDDAGGPNPRTEETIRRAIECTAILGAPWTVIHPATAFGHTPMVAASRQANLAYFSGHLEAANAAGIGICIENMADFAGQGYARSYCAPVEELIDLVDTLQARHGNAGICWDFGHANLFYADQAPCLELIGSRLKVTHVHDNFGLRDDHLTPFRGTVDWHALLPVLRRIGYQGDFSFEIRRMGNHVPRALQDSLWTHAKNVGEYLLTLCDASPR